MSSLGGTTYSGNSVNPGVPGAGNVDRWATYTAIQDIDGGGFTLKNTNIDLCNDAIENVSILDSTLTGTTTLASGHQFTGDMNIDSNTLFVDSTANRIGIVTNSPGAELDVNGAVISRGQLVGQNGVDITGDLDIAGNVVIAPGNALITRNSFSSQPYGYIRSHTSGAVDIYMGENGGYDNPTTDQFGYAMNANIGGGNDLGLTIIAKNGGSGSDSFEEIAKFYSSVNTTGTFIGKGLEVLGNITCGTLGTASSVITPNILNVVNITGDSTTPMTIDNGPAIITLGNTSAGDVNIPRAVFAIGSHGASKVVSNARNVAYIGANPRTTGDINCLQFVAPNGTSNCYAFCGQRDATNPNSVGLASVNQSTGDVVGFAPSAISGVEKWSFTAKHQSQYTGVITKEHRGMVVEATGQVVGLHDKEDFHYGISMENPDYSNATPVVRLCSTRGSKGVIGVVRDIKDEPDTIDGDLVYYVKGEGHEVGDKRVQVNAIGEGLIWVANTNGNIQIGDLVQSSSEAGYAEKQDDDLMRSCTIAKITANCDFIQDKVSKKKILTDDEGHNVLDSQGRLIWINDDEKQDKYLMRYLPNGRKAVLMPCIYHCG